MTSPAENIPNHLVWAILSTLFCCLPLGIVSIVHAAKVNGLIATGDIPAARAASANAKTWAIITTALGLGIPFVVFLSMILDTVGR